MASLLASSERRLVVVLWGEKIVMTDYPGEGVSITASGVPIPEGAEGLLNACNIAIVWGGFTSPPREPLDLGPFWTQSFRFIDDEFGQPSFYAVHDDELGLKESPNLLQILQVMKDWMQNAGIGA